jgi:anthranilate/para-aminobenzoate synthase component II
VLSSLQNSSTSMVRSGCPLAHENDDTATDVHHVSTRCLIWQYHPESRVRAQKYAFIQQRGCNTMRSHDLNLFRGMRTPWRRGSV